MNIETVFDVIDRLRTMRYLSQRKLATLANMHPTTFASMVSRCPKFISKDTLTAIAKVFNLEWYDLIGLEKDSIPEDLLDTRIPTALTSNQVATVMRRFGEKQPGFSFEMYFAENGDGVMMTHTREVFKAGECNDAINAPANPVLPIEAPAREKADTELSEQFKQSFMFVLDKLNSDGLLEAMRSVLAIAQDSKYSKTR